MTHQNSWAAVAFMAPPGSRPGSPAARTAPGRPPRAAGLSPTRRAPDGALPGSAWAAGRRRPRRRPRTATGPGPAPGAVASSQARNRAKASLAGRGDVVAANAPSSPSPSNSAAVGYWSSTDASLYAAVSLMGSPVRGKGLVGRPARPSRAG